MRFDAVKNALGYGMCAAAPAAILFFALGLSRYDLDEPIFAFKGDALFVAMEVQSLLETGSPYTHPRCGAPWTGDTHDFPISERVHLELLAGLHRALGGSAFRAINLYYLATFSLIALVSYFVLRRLNLPRGPGIVAALLFAFLPFHFASGTWHLFLASYFMVPLMVLVIRWQLTSRHADAPPLSTRRRWLNAAGAALVCWLMAWSGIYYAFFGCFFLVVAGVLGACWQRSARPALMGLGCIAVMIVGGLVELRPHLAYMARHGANEIAQPTVYISAENFGLKIAHLLLPTKKHPIPALHELRERYDSMQPLYVSVSLGLCGSVGFLFLLGRWLGRWRSAAPADHPWLDGFAILNLVAVLLATVGGFSALVALGFPSIRAYSRIAVYLAFFSLAAFALLLTWLLRRPTAAWVQLGVRPLVLGTFLAWGLVESLASVVPFDPSVALNRHAVERELAQRAERLLPADTMVFQLPYYPFPECPKVPGKMGAYEHLGMPLVSNSLRWSFGAIKGRGADRWQALTAAQPIEEQVRKLAHAGFGAVLVNRVGYADGGAQVEEELHATLQQEPLVSQNGRLALYSLIDYQERLKQSLTSEQWAQAQERALTMPLETTWKDGFSLPEADAKSQWRWCTGPTGTIRLLNGYGTKRQATVSFLVKSSRRAKLRLVSPQHDQAIDVNSPEGTRVQITIDLDEDWLDLRLTTNARGRYEPPDKRLLYFQVRDFQVREEPTSLSARAANKTP